MHDWSLSQWLKYLESIHPKEIEMGLERVAQVASRLALDFSNSNVITVAGTNGKGSTCVVVEQALKIKSLTVGVYSSPHLLDYKERVRVNGSQLTNQDHCAAFLAVEQARHQVELTYFEFGTLAGLYLLAQAKLDYVLLEVGLGGRLDAVNIIDPDLAVITNVDLDHQAWLGDTREQIGFEKAGIFRTNLAVVIGDPYPPTSVKQEVKRLNCQAVWQGEGFNAEQQQTGWNWQSEQLKLDALPLPHIPVLNASTALAVLQSLNIQLSKPEYVQLFSQARLPGRLQQISSKPTVLLDVAHNRQACDYLATQIQKREYQQLYLVCGMLADKDIQESLAAFQSLHAFWCLAEPDSARSASLSVLQSALVGHAKQKGFESIKEAYSFSVSQAQADDLIVVFGSFYTVADILKGTEISEEE